MIINLNFEVKR